MACPYRYESIFDLSHYCTRNGLFCPEIELSGFDYKQCSTYKEVEKKKNGV